MPSNFSNVVIFGQETMSWFYHDGPQIRSKACARNPRWVANQFTCLKWNAQNSTLQHQSQEKTAKQFTMATFYWMFEHIQYHSISTTYSIRLAWLRADFPLHTPAETSTMKQLSNNWNTTVQIRLLSWNGFDWSHLGSHQGFSDSFVKEPGPNLMYNPFFVKVLSPRICVLARKQCKHGQARKFKRADRDRNMTFLGTVATVAFETQVQLYPLIIFDYLWSTMHAMSGVGHLKLWLWSLQQGLLLLQAHWIISSCMRQQW